jgi:hypothetical protein
LRKGSVVEFAFGANIGKMATLEMGTGGRIQFDLVAEMEGKGGDSSFQIP